MSKNVVSEQSPSSKCRRAESDLRTGGDNVPSQSVASVPLYMHRYRQDQKRVDIQLRCHVYDCAGIPLKVPWK